MITQEFNINIIPHGLPPKVPINQYDTGLRTLIAHVYQDETEIPMTSAYTYTVCGTKPSGTGFSYSATVENGAIVFDVTGQMSVVAGPVRCGILIQDGEDVVGTLAFILYVQKAPLETDTIIDSDDFGSIISSAVADWMDEHGVPIDSTLTNPDAAANAKVTGDALKNRWALDNVTAVENGTDYNTLTTPGVFRCASNSGAASMVNCPTTNAHRLVVQNLSSASTQLQIVFTTGSIVYFRVRVSSAWGGWRQVGDAEALRADISAVQSALDDEEAAREAADTSIAADVSGITSTLDILTDNDSALYVTKDINTTNSGVTRTNVDGKLRLTGTATATRRLVVFNGVNSAKTTSSAFDAVLPAGRYKVSVSSSGKVSTINSVRATYATYADEFVINDNTTVDITAPVMIGVLVESGINYGDAEQNEYTDVSVDFVKIKPVFPEIEAVRDMVIAASPYITKTIKQSGEVNPNTGFAHQAFPDVDYFNGKEVIMSRVGVSHYTPSDQQDYGGVEIDTVSESGELSYIKTITSADFPGLQGELRGLYIHPVSAGALLVCGDTTYNTSDHDCVIALLTKTFSVQNYIVNPFTSVTFSGKPLLTPTGHIILSGYRSGKVYICRSTAPLAGDVSALTYTRTQIDTSAMTTGGNESCLGYLNDKLYLMIRNNDTSESNCIYTTDDPEGVSGWRLYKQYTRETDGINSVIHRPMLLPQSYGRFLVFAGANYRSGTTRNAVIGIIDTENENLPINLGIISDGLNYGGYTGFIRHNDCEYDVCYYKEGGSTTDPSTAIISGLYYKRINTNVLIPFNI